MDTILQDFQRFGDDMVTAGRDTGYAQAITDAMTLIADREDLPDWLRIELATSLAALTPNRRNVLQPSDVVGAINLSTEIKASAAA